MRKILLLSIVVLISSCAPSLKTQRMTTLEGDEKAMTITDDWVAVDTDLATKHIIDKLTNHITKIFGGTNHG